MQLPVQECKQIKGTQTTTEHIKNKSKGKQKQPPKKQLRIDKVLRSARVDNATNNEIVNFGAENETHKNSAGNNTQIDDNNSDYDENDPVKYVICK